MRKTQKKRKKRRMGWTEDDVYTEMKAAGTVSKGKLIKKKKKVSLIHD